MIMKKQEELSIDFNEINEIEYTKVKEGDCLILENRLYIVKETMYVIPEKSHQMSYYVVLDFCTKEEKDFIAYSVMRNIV